MRIAVLASLTFGIGCFAAGEEETSPPATKVRCISASGTEIQTGCFATSEEGTTSQTVIRCTSIPGPDIQSVMAVSDSNLAEAHAGLASLAIVFPADLDFSSDERTAASKRRFARFVATLTKASRATEERYSKVVDGNGPIERRRIACDGALASTAWVAHLFESAPIPTSFDDHQNEVEIKQAYCNALDDKARPAREKISAWRRRCASLER